MSVPVTRVVVSMVRMMVVAMRRLCKGRDGKRQQQ